MQRARHTKLIKNLAVATALAGLTASASANHAWSNYHWARSSNPFTLNLGDNVTRIWDRHLSVASSDWSNAAVLDTVVVAGNINARNCRPNTGRGEVCNAKYGNNGWLGLAQIWVSGSHITQGAVKLNDSYFNTATYNTPEWRQMVSCQEIGHIFGLGHQDEAFDNPNLGSCMDYTNNPGTNQHPNQHDYDELLNIYSHLDDIAVAQSRARNMPAAMLGRDFDRQAAWGQMAKRSKDGARDIFVRDFGNGFKLVTHVFWAQQEGGPAHRQQSANED